MIKRQWAWVFVLGAALLGCDNVGGVLGRDPLKVTSPNGGETWFQGEQHVITWKATGVEGIVRVYYSTDGGATYPHEVASPLATDGWTFWTIPDEDSTRCRVRVRGEGGGPSDESDANFAIAPASITVTAPNGEETWYAGEEHDIVWSAAGVTGNVDIYYSTDGGTNYTLIATVPTEDGIYTWQVPNEETTTCCVMVHEAGGAGLSDVSDGHFAILAMPRFTDIGAGLLGAGNASLAWGDYDNDGDLDLALSGYDGSGTPTTLASIHRNDGLDVFTDIGAGLTRVSAGSLAWGDYDNDGDLDLALAGYDDTDCVSKVYRNSGGPFIDIGAGLTGVGSASLVWGDYDNDGDLDLALSGSNPSGTPTRLASIYQNDGLGIFTDIGAGLQGVGVSSLAWGDYDNDGDLDLALAGMWDDGTQHYESIIYRNDGGIFADIDAQLTGVGQWGQCSLAWGDYDNDGYLDIVIAGRDGTNCTTKIYHNNGDGTFGEIGAGLPGVGWHCSVAWGDYDNDGDLDLALAGQTQPGVITEIYRNDGGGTFVDTDTGLRGLGDCSLAWGDYDNDGDLDLVLAGVWGTYASIIYRNNSAVANAPPSAPTGLSAVIAGAGPYDVTFSWDTGVDSQTRPTGLSYNLRVGTTSGGDEVFSGMAGPSGWRRVPARGIVQPGASANEWTLKGLVAGCYYWSVQAIDTAFAGSPWAAEQSVVVPLGVASPNGAEVWDVGSTQDITWDSVGITNVKIELSRNGGTTWEEIVASTDAAAGTYAWTVTGPASANCLVRVSDALDGDPVDESDMPFTIAGVTITAPNGGEAWNVATAQIITWNSVGVADVKIELSRDGGTGWEDIVASTDAASGMYAWTVTGPGSANCLVRVSDAVDGTPADQSNVAFTIPAITVTAPNGGETWEPDTAQLITWSSAGMANVKIELSRDGGTGWEEIVASTDAATGAYGWVVTGPPSKNCLVRISDAADGTPADTSDAPFTIPLFTDNAAGLVGMYECSLAWGDYDNDGDLDLALAGSAAGRISNIYRNDDGTFTDIGAGLTGVYYCSLAWGDYDNDGDLDLALAGLAGSYVSKVYRNDAGTFVDIGAGLTAVHQCSLAWGDYDNDGDLDLALAGDEGSSEISKVYRNDGGTLTDIGAALTGMDLCSLAWGDYDNDGDLDLALSGLDGGDLVSKVYRNDGGTLFDVAAGLTGVYSCSLAWGDYDSDGDLDLAIAGSYVSSSIYRNDSGTFIDIVAGLTGVGKGSSLAWGDYDNDGDLDLALAGYDGSPRVSKVYRNDGGTFTDTDAGLTGVQYCCLAWGDLDNDGDLDLALAGYVSGSNYISKVYRNNNSVLNSAPSAPDVLSTSVFGSKVTFTWNAATDTETPQLGLSYNVRVGTATGLDDAFCGMADLATGYRRLPALGNAQERLSWTLSLPAGEYYWSVQAVDTAFAGSPWAAEQSAVVPLAVSSPNGGETWDVGSAQTIMWSVFDTMTNAKIELSRNGGTTWEEIVASTDAAAGAYAWTVTGPASADCLVRVSDALDGDPVDESDMPFTITGVTITAPNGGEAWNIATAQIITWSSVGVTDVKIELSRDGGTGWEEIIASTGAASGMYAWTVTGPASISCLVRISDASDGSPVDGSDAAFEIF